MKSFRTIKRIYQMMFQSNPQYIRLSIGLALLEILNPFIYIFFIRYLTDTIVSNRNWIQLSLLCLMFLLSYYSCQILVNRLEKELTIIGNKLNNDFETNLNDRIMHLDYTYLESPEVLDKRDRAIEGIKENNGIKIADINLKIISIISSVIVIAGTLYLIVSISPFVLLILIVTIIGTLFIEKKLSNIELENWKKWIPLNRRFRMVYDLMYNVKNAQDVRIYSTYDFFTSKVTSYNSDSVSILQTEGKTTAQYSILKRLLIMLQFICVQMFVVNKALAGFISIGEYTMYVNSANSFSTNAMLIVQNLVQIQKNLLYVCEYFDFLDLPSKEFETSKKEKATTPHCIEFQDVSFRYPKSKINTLDHINIKFLLDEKIGIVGKNGAGKTTFIKLLLRLYEPSNGKILLDGKDVREYDYSSYLSMFSAVFQDFNIYPISIRENIVSSNFYDSEKLLKILKELNLYSKLLKCSDGVETVASKLIDATGIDFSTGEKQMISMARAIYKPSSILILDEPTSSLDANAENLLYKKYRELSTKKISFFVSHRLASCIFCDSILVFDKGQIVQQGNHKTLINDTSGLYAQMFNLQAAQYK